MAFRGTESPMDFEWQGHGPVDVTSPFHKVAMENQRKRNHAAIESPQKQSMPQLRSPNSQPWFFSNPPPGTDASPFRAPSFTTPRKPMDFDFSSGPESSPVDLADSEETPDAKPLPPLPTDETTRTKRNSLFGIYGRFAPSPGRGEIKKPHGSAIAKRIHKRRRRAQGYDKQLILDRRSSEDTSDDDARPSSSESRDARPPTQEVGWMAGLFGFLHQYPDAPSIIAKYLQVFFNAAILFGCLFMLWSFYATIRADVDRASEEAMAEILAEMATCSKNYIDNRCAADSRAPALETVCSNWEICMNRDPGAVKRARLSAHTFAEIFNSFIEPISLKTMIFTVTFVTLGLVINNVTFSMYRHSQHQQHNMDSYRNPSNHYAGPPGAVGHFPATPGFNHGHQQVPWHSQTPYNDQYRLDYQQSPSKNYVRSRSRSPEKKMLKM